MKKDGKEKIIEDPISGYSKAEYTYADYLSFSLDYMVELIRGKIFKMSPAPTTIHQQISMRLSSHIFNELKGKKCQVFSAPFDVILPIGGKERLQSTTVVQPDIVIICNSDIIEEAGCFG